MFVTQKCQYALRAIFELARRRGSGPIKIAQIAQAQHIPIRFLEVILSQLKQGGFVQSRRGTEGGYQLAVDPDHLTVGQIVGFVDGDPYSANAPDDNAHDLFCAVWRDAASAVQGVFEKITIAQLVEQHSRHDLQSLNYDI